jgi:ABC-type sugar transport system ATPase subunit
MISFGEKPRLDLDKESEAETLGVAGEAAALEVTDLSQRFGERIAVDHLSVAVRSGEILGLVGRNGAGKTTTMRRDGGAHATQR